LIEQWGSSLSQSTYNSNPNKETFTVSFSSADSWKGLASNVNSPKANAYSKLYKANNGSQFIAYADDYANETLWWYAFGY
jgi:hypothetical protein